MKEIETEMVATRKFAIGDKGVRGKRDHRDDAGGRWTLW